MKYKSGFVTIIGRPNVGKSTLLNLLTGSKVAITSNKPQTTRNIIKSIVTDEEAQIIFIDTPGIYRANNKLGEYMVKIAKDSFGNVDVIVYIFDIYKNKNLNGDGHLIEELQKTNKPIILVINKVDTLKSKEEMLPIIDEFKEKLDLKAIIPMSAINANGKVELMKEIKGLLQEGPKYYPDDLYTDQPEKFLAAEIIREKIFRRLSEEIPYGTMVEIISFKEEKKRPLIKIQANIYCEKKSHKSIIIGKSGSMLKTVGTEARKELEKVFGIKIYLELWVKIKNEWRNDQRFLNSMGYRQEK